MSNPPARQTALITGASGGIGLELATLLARERYDLILVARSGAALEKFAVQLRVNHGIRVETVAKDLSSPTSPTSLYLELQKRSLPVDVLINNAGFGTQGPFAKSDLTRQLQLINLNITALTHLTRLFLPPMIQRGYGRILNVASTAAFLPGPLMATYYASKAYVLNFTIALANELRGTGVTATALCPGPTRTNFDRAAGLAESKIFRGNVMSAQDVAVVGYNAMLKGRPYVIAGLKNRLGMLPAPLLPRTVLASIARKFNTVDAPLISPSP